MYNVTCFICFAAVIIADFICFAAVIIVDFICFRCGDYS